jgi:biotin transporter BioY
VTKLERCLLTAILLFIAVCAIGSVGAKYFALLAVFDMFVGIAIGMVLFLPNNDGGD